MDLIHKSVQPLASLGAPRLLIDSHIAFGIWLYLLSDLLKSFPVAPNTSFS